MPVSRFGADQAAEALLELDHRLGQLVVAERVAAAARGSLPAGPPTAAGRARLNGSWVMITFCRASPGTSTPCQKLSVAEQHRRAGSP